MKIKIRIFVIYLVLLIGTISCVNENESEKPNPISQNLIWYSKYVCQNGILSGFYKGELSLSHLIPGERLMVFYGDSLVSDSIIELDSTANFDFKTSEINIKNVKIIYRGDTSQMFSEDSLYASASDESYHPFPISFSISHGRGGGETGFYLLKSDSTRKSLRCRDDIEKIIPDTLKVDDGDIRISLMGDIYGNYYDINLTYKDSAGVDYSFINYHLNFSYHQFPSRNELRRGNFEFHPYIPVFPVDLTFSFNFAFYHIRIEKR